VQPGPPPRGTGQYRQLVSQEQVLGDEVGSVADGASKRRQQERKELGHGHSMPVGTPDPLPVRTIAPLQLVVGVVAQMWQPGGRAARIPDGAAFLAFDRPGFVKVAMNFSLRGQETGPRVEVVTETRVLATDPASRRGFARYWKVIRPGSGAIRRAWLRAIARRAERGT
jgi:hypothetical protein